MIERPPEQTPPVTYTQRRTSRCAPSPSPRSTCVRDVDEGRSPRPGRVAIAAAGPTGVPHASCPGGRRPITRAGGPDQSDERRELESAASLLSGGLRHCANRPAASSPPVLRRRRRTRSRSCVESDRESKGHGVACRAGAMPAGGLCWEPTGLSSGEALRWWAAWEGRKVWRARALGSFEPQCALRLRFGRFGDSSADVSEKNAVQGPEPVRQTGPLSPQNRRHQ